MGKLIYAIIFVVVMDLLFQFSGLLASTSSSTTYVLANLGLTQVENLPTTSFWAVLVSMGTLGVAGVVAATLLGRDYQTIIFFAVSGTLIPLFLGIGQDFLAISKLAAQISPILATVIFAPLMFAYGLTIIEWARLKD